MNERIERLRKESFETPVTLNCERAEIITDFYRENLGKYSIPMTRALAFKVLCTKKSIYIGKDELIVGERGPFPKSVSTYPELNCHSLDDLEVLDTRGKNPYRVPEKCREVYRDKVIPYWRGRTMRDRIFAEIGEEWKETYTAGYFTEFMEQRAPGHTTLDGKFYSKGMEDFKQEIAASLDSLDFKNDPDATQKREQLKAMSIACDAVVLFAERHGELASKMAEAESDPVRKEELERIAANCMHVPRHAPRDFWEALQMYWFMHLGTITELNGWDAMNPGHLDRYFYPFYSRELEVGAITRQRAKELLSAFWIKFNNHPAPPKVGVTAAESGTYNDFTNINLGGLLPDGTDGVNEISYMMLEVLDEIHLLQPQANIQLSRKTPDRFLKAAARIIRKGYGYPSIFNADTVIEQMIRAGKRVEDAREGGTSGCVETGAFGKEAYILTGYLNTPKILELTLGNGVDPVSGKKIGIESGDPATFKTFDELYAAFEKQLHHIVEIKIKGNQFIERMYAEHAPAVFLSVLIDDCIKNGKDYNDGGPRYNTNYIQCVGIGTITDSLSVLKKHVFEEKTFRMGEVLKAMEGNFEGREAMRLTLANKTPRWGNDDEYADGLMSRVFNSLFKEIDGRPNTKGGYYHIDMLPTTCHIYFGSVMGASPDGRFAHAPLSEGISPVQGADRNGPTAVIKSCGKMDHIRTGGTLLNMKFMPKVLEGENGIDKISKLVRTYFRYDGHHVQFNVVDSKTLRDAQVHPENFRDLIVRVAGYSDYFCDIGKDLQEEIISRTTQEEV
ncbi:MAG: glycyl radical protein [Anaerolineales bacterium]|nr:glycyl radical protein [Anaerolineales bacterium]